MKCFTNEIYPVALVLSYDAESVNEKYYNVCEGTDRPIEIKPTKDACTMFLSERESPNHMAVGIIFNKRPNERLIGHEAFHAAIKMLDVGCGIYLSIGTEEAYAYLIGWICDCIDKFRNTTEFKELSI